MKIVFRQGADSRARNRKTRPGALQGVAERAAPPAEEGSRKPEIWRSHEH
jgi:hypothetical protein